VFSQCRSVFGQPIVWFGHRGEPPLAVAECNHQLYQWRIVLWPWLVQNHAVRLPHAAAYREGVATLLPAEPRSRQTLRGPAAGACWEVVPRFCLQRAPRQRCFSTVMHLFAVATRSLSRRSASFSIAEARY